MKQPLIIIAGPTAVGKSSLSVELAKRINAQIISADSMQVYKYMDIGTAKITSEQMQGIKHYLIDELCPDEEFNVTIYKERAERYIKQISEAGSIPMIVGGTGFYIQAVLYDIDFTEHNDLCADNNAVMETEDTSYRAELYKLAEQNGRDLLFDKLTEVDPEYANIIHRNNVKKVIRALEYHHLTGNKLSEHNLEQSQKASPYNSIFFVINDDRRKIYDRINHRVDDMFRDGLEAEVKALMDRGYGREHISMLGIGYKEVMDYFDGKYSLDEVKEIIKKGTRHYARRQITWFKREKNTIQINLSEFYNMEAITEFMVDTIKNHIDI